jgi:hypothetical protein
LIVDKGFKVDFSIRVGLRFLLLGLEQNSRQLMDAL